MTTKTKKTKTHWLTDPKECARLIKVPLKEWPGNCYAIACAIVEAGLVRNARAVYGHFHGAVSPKSMFWPAYSKAGWCRHGWVYAQSEGSIVDPTRWVFEAETPYIYVGRLTKEYDEGGNAMRAALMRPPPAFEEVARPGAKHEAYLLEMPSKAMAHVDFLLQGQLGPDFQMSGMQLFWLANVPVQMLGKHAKPIYKAIVALDREALIPIDNKRMILGDD